MDYTQFLREAAQKQCRKGGPLSKMARAQSPFAHCMNKDSLVYLLPPELCSRLCGYLDASAIQALTGVCKDWTAKLRKMDGLSHLSLVFSPASRVRSWPSRFLSTLSNLRSLYVALPGQTRSTSFALTLKEEDVKSLPKTLTRLTLDFQASVSNDLMAFLPPNLLSLAIPSCATLNGSCLALLPRTLIRLELPKTHVIKDADLQHLPPHLTWLDLSSATITAAGLPFIPHTVTYFNIEKNESLTPNVLEQLPPDLTELRAIRLLKALNDQHVQHLPMHLRTLNLGWNGNLTEVGIAKLPKELVSFSSLWNENLLDPSVRALPRGIRELWIGWGKITDRGFKYLPPHLTSLVVDAPRMTCEALKHLPRTLTSLTLGAASGLTDEGMKNIVAPLTSFTCPYSSLTAACLPLLPRSLTALNLNARVWHSLTPQDLPHLPPKLLALSLEHNDKLTDDCFALLPRHLTSFNAKSLVVQNQTNLAKLPLHLTLLRLVASPALSDASITLLPRHLECLYFEGADFSPAAAIHLPPHLRELSMSFKASQYDEPLSSFNAEHQAAVIPLAHVAPSDLPLPGTLTFLKSSSTHAFRREHSIAPWLNVEEVARLKSWMH